MKTIDHQGDTWRVLSEGASRDDGMTFCHLASTTRFVQQRNGPYPIQACDWVKIWNPPVGFDSWNRSMRGAYRKGYDAAEAGEPASACPYQDKRKSDGRLTWSRAFEAAWRDGWIADDAARKSSAITDHYTDRANSGLAALAR